MVNNFVVFTRILRQPNIPIGIKISMRLDLIIAHIPKYMQWKSLN